MPHHTLLNPGFYGTPKEEAERDHGRGSISVRYARREDVAWSSLSWTGTNLLASDLPV